MPKITFLPQNITVEALNSEPLLDAARAAGVSAEAPCGGKGVCRKCGIKVISGKIDVKSGSYRSGNALLCRSYTADSDAVIEILSGLYGEQGSFDDGCFISETPIDPPVKQIELSVSQPAPLDGFSDFDRLQKAFKSNVPLSVLQKLPVKLRENGGKITAVYHAGSTVIDIAESGGMYGIAADIGTTTITLWLVDLVTGDILSRKTDYNAQIEFGLDVISRINCAQKNLDELRGRVLGTINSLIGAAAAETGIGAEKIYCASITGNTVMTHLFLGVCPEYIRLAPYTPAVFSVPEYTAEHTKLSINANAPVKIAPAVGSYVGGDVVAGALCTPLADERENGIMLFMDIGTNGEILLGSGEFILGCACSAGPAFEGGGIECGMRASRGAIDDFKIGEKGEVTISTIGGAPPAGICGSGIIAAVAEMKKAGVIDAAGRFSGAMPERIKKGARPHKFCITDNITVSEADIENFIRAKGAVFSACRTLLNNIGLGFGDIEKIYIAGGFGRYLDIANAKAVGLLPNVAAEKIIYLGNTSILGAYKILTSEQNEKLAKKTADRITYIDLSSEPGYMDEYLAALFLPHTDAGLFG